MTSSSTGKFSAVFIGYDPREHAAARVCEWSILRSENPVPVHFLKHRELRKNLGFNRSWILDRSGQYWDEKDKRPFSTEFSHSRFLTQFEAKRLGFSGWVMFCDCDFIFLDEISSISSILDDNKAMYCVKHIWDSAKDGTKMDGVAQQTYHRKLWSSMFFVNLDHPSTWNLTINDVNEKTGSYLHALSWLKDDEIGELPVSWNFIPGLNEELLVPKAVHFSFKGPWLKEKEELDKWDDLWFEILKEMLGQYWWSDHFSWTY